MNICTYLYIIILFVIFSPDILFSIPSSKNKWIRVIIHAFLFSIVWLFTHKIICRLWDTLFSIKEGNEGGTVVVNPGSTTIPPQPPLNPVEPTPPNKCFKYHHNDNSQSNFCVTTSKNKISNKLHSFCYGDTNGCLWFNNVCNEDKDCDAKYTFGTSRMYTDNGFDCSQQKGGWAKWACDNAIII